MRPDCHLGIGPLGHEGIELPIRFPGPAKLVVVALVQQPPRSNAKRERKPLDNGRAGISCAPLNVTHICPVYPGTVGIVFLAPALTEAERPDIPADALANIHPA